MNRTKVVVSCYVLFLPCIVQFVALLCNMVLQPFGAYLPADAWKSIFDVCIIFFLFVTYRKIDKRIVLFIITVVLVAVISVVLYGSAQVSDARLNTLLLSALPYCLLGNYMDFNDKSIRLYRNMAMLCLTINAIYSVYYLSSGRTTLSDNMDFAYRIMPCVLLLLYYALLRGGTLNWTYAGLGCVYLLLQGTRGPMLCVAAFVVLFVIKKYGPSRTVFIGCIFVVLIAFALESAWFNKLIQSLSLVIDNAGLSSRFLTLLFNNNIASDNGRNFIQEAIIDGIRTHPFTGNGIFSDRIMTVGLYSTEYSYGIGSVGTYAHNIVLEMLCDFGIVIGSSLLIVLTVRLFKAYKYLPIESNCILLIYTCDGFIHLLLSGSYLQDSAFFLLIGLLFSISKKKREESIV